MINNLTPEEIKNCISNIKKFNGLNFKYKDKNGSNFIFRWTGNSFEILLDQNEKINFKDREKMNNLIKWNSEITIKMIHLRNTFIYATTYLERYKVSNSSKDQQYFRYFAEVISYYFISVRDCILQLINSFIGSPIKDEYKVSLDSLRKKLEDRNKDILNLLNEFESNIKEFREEVRNGFTHKTNPFNHYFITTIENQDSLGISYTKTIDNEEFNNIIIQNLKFLSNYIESLRSVML